jgi:hypothetical protein
VAVIEVTRSITTGEWHAHIHALTHGDYYPYDALRRVWRRATGGAEIVFVQRVNCHRKAARYVAKYITKPSDIARWPQSAICEWASAITGRRTLITSGDAHGVPQARPVKAPPPRQLTPKLGWSTLRLAITAGLPAATVLAARLDGINHRLWEYMVDRGVSAKTMPPADQQLTNASNETLYMAVVAWHECRLPPPPAPVTAHPRPCRPTDTPFFPAAGGAGDAA